MYRPVYMTQKNIASSSELHQEYLHQNITEVHCKLVYLLRTDSKSYLTSKSVILTVNDLISYKTATVI